MLAHGVSKAELMDMTPAEIWYLFERTDQVGARQRLKLVSDLVSVAAPSQFKEGTKVLDQHIEALKRAAGLSSPYTEETNPTDARNG